MSFSISTAAATALMLATTSALAAPPPLAVTRAVEITASPAKVWAVMGNFADMSYLDAIVDRTEIVKGQNNVVGAQRRISLKNGGTVLETLTARQPYRLSYRMDESGLPVSDYTATLRVNSAGQGSTLTWSGQFRAKAADNAAGTDPDKVAIETISGLYEGGLAAIKAAAEQ